MIVRIYENGKLSTNDVEIEGINFTEQEVDAPDLSYVKLVEGSLVVLTEEEYQAKLKKEEFRNKAMEAGAMIGDRQAQLAWIQKRLNILKSLSDKEYEELRKTERLKAKVVEAEDALLETKEDVISYLEKELKKG